MLSLVESAPKSSSYLAIWHSLPLKITSELASRNVDNTVDEIQLKVSSNLIVPLATLYRSILTHL